ncbi:MAG: hypothetical protein IPJ22_04300 [Bacteroidetes bacterium]|nr:hypothetical protein [Bacteroidota bacterium]
MNFITGNDRHQLQFLSLDDRIAVKNPVRFMDAFVDQIDLPKLRFLLNKKTNRS